MKLSHRSGAIITVFFLAAAVLPSCSSSPSIPKASGTQTLEACELATLAKVKKPITITFWDAEGDINKTTLQNLTNEFNASQTKVHVTAITEVSYTTVWTKYQAGLSNGQLPDVAQLTQTDLQGAIDSESTLPVQSCINTSHATTKDFVPRILNYYKTNNIEEAMPFAVSDPVVYYNKNAFVQAGLNPNDPPATLPEFLADAKALKAHGSGTALKLDSWHLETWLATANQLFVNHTNGRSGRATASAFTTRVATKIFSELDTLIKSGDGTTVPSSGTTQYNNLKGIGNGKYGMTIDSSADLGEIVGLASGYPSVSIGVGPFPLLGTQEAGSGGVEPGGSALYISDKVPAIDQAAAWEYITFLTSTKSQATWAADTGYIPVRESSTTTPTLLTRWASDPAFKVAYTELVSGPSTSGTSGAVIGPYATVRKIELQTEEKIFQTHLTPATAVKTAATKINAVLSSYNQRVGTT